MSRKELHVYHGKNRRMDDPIRNSPQETPTNDIQATPLKRHRPEISSTSTSPPVQYSRRSLPSSSGGVGMDDMWTSFFTEISGRDDDDFPLGDLIDKHLSMEKYHEKVKELGFETALQTGAEPHTRLCGLLPALNFHFFLILLIVLI
jgi:hypothetical protein